MQDLYGTNSGGVNGNFLLDADSVRPDNGGTSLIGGAGDDWFWFLGSSAKSDIVTGLSLGEVVTLT